MKAFFTTLFAALVFAIQTFAGDTNDKQILDWCKSSDAVVHIRVNATPGAKDPQLYLVKSVSFVSTIKKANSFLGDAGVAYALTMVRPGDTLPAYFHEIQLPGDYVVFCQAIVGDVTLPLGPRIEISGLSKDDDSRIRKLCQQVSDTERN
jgi:hypothetical protein